jgi:hypothetical protein
VNSTRDLFLRFSPSPASTTPGKRYQRLNYRLLNYPKTFEVVFITGLEKTEMSAMSKTYKIAVIAIHSDTPYPD